MYSDIFDDLWEAHVKRKMLDQVDRNRREMVMSLYANGNIGGDDLKNALSDLNDSHDEAREMIISGAMDTDEDNVEATDGFVTDLDSTFFSKAKKAE